MGIISGVIATYVGGGLEGPDFGNLKYIHHIGCIPTGIISLAVLGIPVFPKSAEKAVRTAALEKLASAVPRFDGRCERFSDSLV